MQVEDAFKREHSELLEAQRKEIDALMEERRQMETRLVEERMERERKYQEEVRLVCLEGVRKLEKFHNIIIAAGRHAK